MGEGKRGLESLVVWQRARALALSVCRDVVPRFPQEEKWSLAIQLRRSAQSVPANIAEGFGRYYYQEGIRFCYIARGSLDEMWSHLRLAADLGHVTPVDFGRISTEIDEVRRLLNGYIAFLKRSRRGELEPGAPSSVREVAVEYLGEVEKDDTDNNDSDAKETSHA